MKASVVTLGCKVNEYESQSILNQLKQEGYQITEGFVEADIYVVNTCAVTNTAERKSRQVLSKLEKLNPDAKIIVCGCAAQNNPTQFLINKNVIALTGNAGKEEILKFIEKQNKTLPEIDHMHYKKMARPIETRTRQFIKIQDGCDFFCSYCLIPYVRGRSRSRDLDDVIDEI
ncbi:MAG: tRNA (N(6)-L-threonylcarbamoyladenosine(37)-C(2))-methylthiotransferase MtaB, partial [Clostridia bacterium]|nr:tRNA (N(6)-L-threonylcarbamoyladenosine(37)-C(2))-methylthiotransferase MtaB [Clostridia bacterium]